MTKEEQIRLIEEALEEARGWWDFEACEILETQLQELRESNG